MNTPITHIPIDSITVGKRLRKDLGDIEGLAESIRNIGLLHPLIVDDDGTLIAGERRLKAMQKLGFEEAPVRYWQSLGADDRRLIELEENIRRKDLTELERSRKLSELVQTAREVDKAEIRSGVERISQATKPEQPGSLRRVSERIGVPVSTINEAQAHVAIADEFPQIGFVHKTDAVKIARKLNAMPEEEREETAARLRQNHTATIAALVDKAPITTDPTQVAAATAGQRWLKALNDITNQFAAMERGGGLSEHFPHWSAEERRDLCHWTSRSIERLTKFHAELKGLMNEQG